MRLGSLRAWPKASPRRIAAAAVLFLLASILQVAPLSAETNHPNPERVPEPVAPPAVVPVAEDQISDKTIAALAADPSSAPPGTRINIEVHGPSLQRVRAAVRSNDGEVYGSVPGFFVEARVPVEQLQALNESESVTRISSVTRAGTIKPERSNSTNTPLETTVATTMNFEAWHELGHTGAGQKVGILDVFGTAELEFAISKGRVRSPSGVFCRDGGDQCRNSLKVGPGPHGVAVAEVIHHIAPDAELYFATATTLSDLRDAIDWFAAEGVTVINRSESAVFDGPGDGTGPTASLVERAVALDMIWVVSAGNSAGSENNNGGNWIGQFSDPDGNGFHNWADGEERMRFGCGFMHGMRWDDWNTTTIATDYDVWIYDDVDDTIPQFRGNNAQSEPAHPPLEEIDFTCGGPSDFDYIAIRKIADLEPDGVDTIQILGNQVKFDEWVNAGSATGPSVDSNSPGSITVGATRHAKSVELAEYSAHGPTFDGRNGIDIVAPSCLPSPELFNPCFVGTSASAPVIAGTMAVLRGAGVIDSAVEAESILPQISVDQGAPGTDTQYGYGVLRLPEPAQLGARTFLPTCNGEAATIVGSNGDDVLVGTIGRDVIVARGGDDVITGLGGNDLICGGFGNDVIDGGPGDDALFAGPGSDRVHGRAGADLIFGGYGHDDLEGNAGDDEVRGFAGRDYVKGGVGDDRVHGGDGVDRLIGGAGLDQLYGGQGLDRCREPIEVATSCRN